MSATSTSSLSVITVTSYRRKKKKSSPRLCLLDDDVILLQLPEPSICYSLAKIGAIVV